MKRTYRFYRQIEVRNAKHPLSDLSTANCTPELSDTRHKLTSGGQFSVLVVKH